MKVKISISIILIIALFCFIAANSKIKYARLVLQARKQQVDKNYHKAVSYYNQALAQLPGEFEIYKELAGLYKVTGQNEELEKIYEKGLKVKPGDQLFLNECINIAINKKNYPQAEILLKKALKGKPEKGKLHFLLGRVLQNQGKNTDALKSFEKAIEYHFDKGRCWYNMACIYEYNLKDMEKAIELYSKALRSEPADKFGIKNKINSYSIWAKGESYENKRLFKDAVKEYESRLEESPTNTAIITRLGRAYRKNYQFPESEKIYVKALNRNKTDYYLLNNLGSLYYDIQRYKDAQSCWSDAIISDYSKPNAHFNMGALYAKTGNFEASESEYMKALELGYNNAMVYFQLAELYQNYIKNETKASEFRNKALSSPDLPQMIIPAEPESTAQTPPEPQPSASFTPEKQADIH